MWRVRAGCSRLNTQHGDETAKCEPKAELDVLEELPRAWVVHEMESDRGEKEVRGRGADLHLSVCVCHRRRTSDH